MLGKIGYNYEKILHVMPAGLVNQLMSCHWLEQGHELVSADDEKTSSINVEALIKKIRSRPKPKFDF